MPSCLVFSAPLFADMEYQGIEYGGMECGDMKHSHDMALPDVALTRLSLTQLFGSALLTWHRCLTHVLDTCTCRGGRDLPMRAHPQRPRHWIALTEILQSTSSSAPRPGRHHTHPRRTRYPARAANHAASTCHGANREPEPLFGLAST